MREYFLKFIRFGEDLNECIVLYFDRVFVGLDQSFGPHIEDQKEKYTRARHQKSWRDEYDDQFRQGLGCFCDDL
jgi:hypothetical protein